MFRCAKQGGDGRDINQKSGDAAGRQRFFDRQDSDGGKSTLKSNQDDDLAARFVLLHAAVRLDDVVELEHLADLDPQCARMSVSLHAATYAELRALSGEYDVSAAWLHRRAVKEFIERNRTAGPTVLPLARLSAKGRGGNPQ